MTPSQKKWAIIIGSAVAVVGIGYLTKDKWMPLFKKETPVAPTGKPPVISSTGSNTAEKSNFSTDLNYPKSKSDLNYPKAKANFNYPYKANGVMKTASGLSNRASFDGGIFTMVDITKKQNGAGFNFQKVGFAGNGNLDNQPS